MIPAKEPKEHADGRRPAVARSWISKTPGVVGGDPCIRNTRISVHGLVEWRQLGWSDAKLLENFPHLTQSDLDAAWEYSSHHPAEFAEAIKADREA